MMHLMPRRRFYLLLVLIAVAILLVQQVFERRHRALLEETHLQALSEQVSGLRFYLESTVANNLALVNSLAAFISAYPDFAPEQYRQYARQVLEREPALVNLAAAPDMVVRHVYPEAGNEAALGLDYMQQPDQREAVERAVATESLVVAGPVELVQGGLAIIGRAPVFVPDDAGGERLWGIVSAPMRLGEIYAAVERFEAVAGVNLAIRGRDGLGASGPAFYGDDDLFSRDMRVVLPINVGSGVWELVAVSAQPPTAGNLGIQAGRAGAVLFGGISLLALWRRRQQQERSHALEQRVLENERFLRAVEAVSQVGGWRLDEQGRFTELSAQAQELLGLEQRQLPLPVAALTAAFEPESSSLLSQKLLAALRTQHGFSVELPLRRSDGVPVWLLLKGEPLESGTAAGLIGAVQDVTRAREQDSLIHYQANYDALTDLPNRALFQQRLETSLWQARRDSTRLAVLFLDLDNFKSVNDNLGHDIGDDLLVEAARRLRAGVRQEDTVARYSGDEFVVVLTGGLSATDAMHVAAKLVGAMAEPFHLGERRIYCSASVGVALFPEHGEDADTLLIKADQAMYEAKRRGRNGWQFYSTEMQEESEHKHRLYNDLLQALDGDDLEVHYQPVFATCSGEVLGCEALIRWQRADGWESPEAFVAVAEERGIINRLDSFVLSRALEDMRRLGEATGQWPGLGVNVSPRLLQMRDDYARDWLEQIRGEQTLQLTVEITERMLVQNATSARQILGEIHDCGVRVSIDDFGTGYSGLGYLSRFPVHAIKIDRSFVSQIGGQGNEESLIESMVQLATRLGIEVVAEGVETPAQIAFLRELGCTALQGFALARPMPIDALIAFLRERS